ncbi:MAG: rhodanese-like domain-containing protein [Holophagales bacterium]|nr:rhodanese-like domain-containing protein [Holophagales bacterium]MXX62895.1 rhodanese-like domain-containing protein [Holophagales bacterium]MYI31860.1 rhodanese-like domain-containing protein [Holophagales bacterium]
MIMESRPRHDRCRRHTPMSGRNPRIPKIGALMLGALMALTCGAPTMSQLKALVRASFPGVPQMSIEELDRRLEEEPPPLVIDVREPFEYEVSHLPGAVHAQGGDIAEAVAAADRDRPIVLYCSVGYRSSAAVADLIQLHDPDILDRVWNLEGSIFEWANSGRPVYRGGVEVDRVHPYDKQWGKLLEPHLRP